MFPGTTIIHGELSGLQAERFIKEAAEQGCELVVFPEAFIGGYPRGSNFGVVMGSRSPEGKEEFRCAANVAL